MSEKSDTVKEIRYNINGDPVEIDPSWRDPNNGYFRRGNKFAKLAKGRMSVRTLLRNLLAQTDPESGKTMAQVVLEDIIAQARHGNTAAIRVIWEQLEGTLGSEADDDAVLALIAALEQSRIEDSKRARGSEK